MHILIIFHWLNLTYHLRSLLLPRLHLHFYSLGLFILPKIMYILFMNIKIWPQLLIFFLLHQFRPKYCIGTCFFVLHIKQWCRMVKNWGISGNSELIFHPWFRHHCYVLWIVSFYFSQNTTFQSPDLKVGRLKLEINPIPEDFSIHGPQTP